MQKYENKPVRDMKLDDAVEGFYLMKNPSPKTTQSGKDYLVFNLADATGEIEAKLWDYAGDLHTKCNGKPVKVRGNITEYNGKKQLTAALLRETRADDQIDLTKLVPVAPIDPQQTLSQMIDILDSVQDEEYKKICFAVLDRYKDVYCCIPAAKQVHHAFRYGLLMHSFYMLCHADHMARMYSFLNRDLLITGTFCHDIGKIKEFQFSEMGLVNDYSVPGQLLGHLYIGAKEVSEIAESLGISEEKSMLLQHMLLSHHGKPEYGACVVPKTAEALILHMIDDLDGKMEVYRETVESAESTGMTDRIWPLDTKVYIHN